MFYIIVTAALLATAHGTQHNERALALEGATESLDLVRVKNYEVSNLRSQQSLLPTHCKPLSHLTLSPVQVIVSNYTLDIPPMHPRLHSTFCPAMLNISPKYLEITQICNCITFQTESYIIQRCTRIFCAVVYCSAPNLTVLLT